MLAERPGEFLQYALWSFEKKARYVPLRTARLCGQCDVVDFWKSNRILHETRAAVPMRLRDSVVV